MTAILVVLTAEKQKGKRAEGQKIKSMHNAQFTIHNRLQGDDFTDGRVGRGA